MKIALSFSLRGTEYAKTKTIEAGNANRLQSLFNLCDGMAKIIDDGPDAPIDGAISVLEDGVASQTFAFKMDDDASEYPAMILNALENAIDLAGA